MIQKLKNWMDRHDYSQTQLGRAIGYRPSSVCDVLRGRREPSYRFKAMIEQATGLPASGWATKKKARV